MSIGEACYFGVCDCCDHADIQPDTVEELGRQYPDAMELAKVIVPTLQNHLDKIGKQAALRDLANRRRDQELQDEIRWHRKVRYESERAIERAINEISTAYWADKISDQQPIRVSEEVRRLKAEIIRIVRGK